MGTPVFFSDSVAGAAALSEESIIFYADRGYTPITDHGMSPRVIGRSAGEMLEPC